MRTILIASVLMLSGCATKPARIDSDIFLKERPSIDTSILVKCKAQIPELIPDSKGEVELKDSLLALKDTKIKFDECAGKDEAKRLWICDLLKIKDCPE